MPPQICREGSRATCFIGSGVTEGGGVGVAPPLPVGEGEFSPPPPQSVLLNGSLWKGGRWRPRPRRPSCKFPGGSLHPRFGVGKETLGRGLPPVLVGVCLPALLSLQAPPPGFLGAPSPSWPACWGLSSESPGDPSRGRGPDRPEEREVGGSSLRNWGEGEGRSSASGGLVLPSRPPLPGWGSCCS